MKNLYIIPTNRPSRLWTNNLKSRLQLDTFPSHHPFNIGKNIYITSDEEIKEGDWIFYPLSLGCTKTTISSKGLEQEGIPAKKIVLTTDQELIKDGIQTFDEEFLEWFIKYPSCEVVIVSTYHVKGDISGKLHYKITRPNYPIGGYAPGHYSCTCVTCKNEFMGDKRAVQCESCAFEMVYTKITVNDKDGILIEPQENTLEHAAGNLADPNICKTGNWIAGAKWQAERMYSEKEVLDIIGLFVNDEPHNTKEWFEQFKKK